MTDDNSPGNAPNADIRAAWDTPELRGLWNRAREVLESADPPATFRLELADEATREAVGELYGRPMWGQGTRISVSKLDAQLTEKTGLSLVNVLEILHDRPVTRSTGEVRDERRDSVISVLRSALSEHGLAGAPWAESWVQWVHQFGRVADDELDVVARRAAAVLAELALDRHPTSWIARSDLATRLGDAYQLDSGTTLSRVVLRAAATAREVESPGNERERRALWERCGVTMEAVSATVLCWALPLPGEDAWSCGVHQRTALGLPTHFTHLDLHAAPERLVAAGTTIAVCENPRVLEAAAQQNIQHPLVCVSGYPATVAAELLGKLTADGARLRYHGDLDWPGVAIARSLWTNHDVDLWRMAAADYREAVNLAAATRTDLPTLAGEPTDTPWDTDLAELMGLAGRAVEEETVLPTLLDDLRAGLG